MGKKAAVLVPAPNQYNPSDIIHMKPPSYGVGTSKRRPLSAQTGANPGPGSYQTRKGVGEGPTYVMGLKGDDPDKFKMKVPGPGAYQP